MKNIKKTTSRLVKKNVKKMRSVAERVKSTGVFEPNKTSRKNDVWKHSLVVKNLPAYFLLFSIIAVFGSFLYIIWPFVTVIFVGAVLAISFYPVYRFFLRFFRGWERTASFVTILLVIAIILVPLGLFLLLLGSEAVGVYQNFQTQLSTGVFDKYLRFDGLIDALKLQVSPFFDLETLDLKSNLLNMAKELSGFLFTQTGNLIAGLSNILFGIIVMLFVMFYFFKDGKQIVSKIGMLSPLPSSYEVELFDQMGSMVKAVVFGVFLTAIAQGVVGGIGFVIVGFSNPVFWAAAIAFFSLVPLVGTALIWVPASIVLFILGDYGAGIFLFLWGVFVIGSVDNFLRPYLIGGKAKTYPLLTFLVVLGGVLVMGLKGVVVGPLVLIMLMSFLHIYQAEYMPILKN